MSPIHFILRRDDDDSAEKPGMNPNIAKALIALVVLVMVALMAIGALFILRHVRRARKAAEEQLPMYNEKRSSTSSSRRMTITTAASEKGRPDSVIIYNEKHSLMEKGPDSPVPEIRITFPEEIDESGKRQSGRVVVVRVGETSIGLEPLQKDDLPPYQRDTSERFQSLDLDRIGGLKEKDISV